MISKIKKQISRSLRGKCQAVYIYGSQLIVEDQNKDVDLAIICSPKDKLNIAKKINEIQKSMQQLIHPIFLSESDIARNPDFRKIISNSYKLI